MFEEFVKRSNKLSALESYLINCLGYLEKYLEKKSMNSSFVLDKLLPSRPKNLKVDGTYLTRLHDSQFFIDHRFNTKSYNYLYIAAISNDFLFI